MYGLTELVLKCKYHTIEPKARPHQVTENKLNEKKIIIFIMKFKMQWTDELNEIKFILPCALFLLSQLNKISEFQDVTDLQSNNNNSRCSAKRDTNIYI